MSAGRMGVSLLQGCFPREGTHALGDGPAPGIILAALSGFGDLTRSKCSWEGKVSQGSEEIRM